MKVTDFCIVTDSTGDRYITTSDRLTKCSRRETSSETDLWHRIYHLPGNPLCAVTSFEKYVAKLNRELDNFWQKPATRHIAEEDTCWYKSIPLGQKRLSSKMKSLSVDAGLSVIYTNKCLSITGRPTLNNFHARHPVRVVGYRGRREMSLDTAAGNVTTVGNTSAHVGNTSTTVTAENDDRWTAEDTLTPQYSLSDSITTLGIKVSVMN